MLSPQRPGLTTVREHMKRQKTENQAKSIKGLRKVPQKVWNILHVEDLAKMSTKQSWCSIKGERNSRQRTLVLNVAIYFLKWSKQIDFKLQLIF